MNTFFKYNFAEVPTTYCTKTLQSLPEARSSETAPYTAAPVSLAGAHHMTAGVLTIQLDMSKLCQLNVSTVTVTTCCVDTEHVANCHTPHRHATHPQTAPWAQWSSCLGDVKLESKKNGVIPYEQWDSNQRTDSWHPGHCLKAYSMYRHGVHNTLKHTEP